MTRILSIAVCLGVVALGHGCATDDAQAVDQEVGIAGAQCGTNVCTGKTFCCNASCGICAPLGGGCPDVACAAADPADSDDPTALVSEPEPEAAPGIPAPIIGPIGPQQCGANTCTGNTHCCNASCGTCVGPGGECTDQICLPTD